MGVQRLYTDGGVVSRNPSPLGGTWAWCLVEGNELAASGSGFVVPADFALPRVTNNLTEFLAAVLALEYVGSAWEGCLYTDSRITLKLLDVGGSFKGIPRVLRERLEALWKGRKWRAAQVAGHATRDEIFSGVRRSDGVPTSRWNTWCDEACRRQAQLFRTKVAARVLTAGR